MERTILNGLAVYRWVAWSWMAIVLVLARGKLARPVIAAALVATALGVTVWLTVRSSRGAPATPRTVGVEVGVGLALQLFDGIVYRDGHVFGPHQPLGVAWPIAGVLAAGITLGPFGGVATGVLLGGGRALSSILHAPEPADVDGVVFGLEPAWMLSLVTTTVMFAMAGGVAGYLTELLRQTERRAVRAERDLADVRAREEIARRLHDGVLQTLAMVERRTDDAALSRMAREQDTELREYLFGTSTSTEGVRALGDALRHAARRATTTFGLRVEVLVPDDLPELDIRRTEAVAGAVAEALNNAAKHGHAQRVTVYAEPVFSEEEGQSEPTAATQVFIGVRDDGDGFQPGQVTEGVGLTRSIRGRITEIGGHVEVASSPGRGTEIQLTLPVA